MKTTNLLASCLLATTVYCAAEIRTVTELHDSLKDKYPDQVEKTPNATMISPPLERQNIVRKVLAERQEKLKGEPAPEIQFVDKDGNNKRLSDLRGKSVVVAFVRGSLMSPDAKSCPPHAALRDSLKRNAKRITDSGVHIVMVELQGTRPSPSLLKEYLNDTPYTGITVDSETRYSYEWGVYGTPNVFIVDGFGKVACLPRDITSPPTNRSERLEPALDLIDALPPAAPALPVARTITDTKGRSIEGKILGKSENSITFQRNGDAKAFEIKLETLSAGDKEFVATLANGQAAAATPATAEPATSD